MQPSIPLRLRISILGLLGILPCALAAEDQQVSSEYRKFLSARTEILENCYDCYGGDSERLLEGINALQTLVDSGYKSREALELLATSKRDYALAELPRDSQEQRDAIEFHKNTYRELLDSNPDSVDLLAEYVRSNSISLQNNELNRLINLGEAMLADAYYLAGVNALTDNDIDRQEDGLESLRKAFEIGNTNQKKLYGSKLANTLEGMNRNAEAAEVLSRLPVN